MVPLRGRCLAHRPVGCGAYQNHVSEAFERLMISFRDVGLTPNRDLHISVRPALTSLSSTHALTTAGSALPPYPWERPPIAVSMTLTMCPFLHL